MSILGYFTSLEPNNTLKIDIVNSIKCSSLKKQGVGALLLNIYFYHVR